MKTNHTDLAAIVSEKDAERDAIVEYLKTARSRVWTADLVGGQISVERMAEIVRAVQVAQAALHSQAQEREGWVLVPKVATEEMLEAACVYDAQPRSENGDDWNRTTWELMIAAAPTGGSEP